MLLDVGVDVGRSGAVVIVRSSPACSRSVAACCMFVGC